jgi:uncharacterized protein (TIGR02246 family)
MFAEVSDVFKNYKDAVYEKDVEKFLAPYAPDVQLYDCWNSWEYNGIEEWKAAVTEWFSGLEEGMRLRTELSGESRKENADLAHVQGNMSFAAVDGEGKELRKMVNRFTFLLEKVDGSWQITHEHSSLPISTEDGKAIFE